MRFFCKTLCLIGIVLLFGASVAQAQRGGYRKMICRGGDAAFAIDENEDGGKIQLSINFSASKRVPGNDVWKMDAGTCTWADRLVGELEPVQIVLSVSADVARRIRTHLNSSSNNFWQFSVRDTKRGHYETRDHAQLIVTSKAAGGKKK